MPMNPTTDTTAIPTTSSQAAAGWRPWFVRLRAAVIAIAVLAFALLGGAIANAGTLPPTAWNRVGTVAALALFYLFLVHRLGRGSKVAMLRMHISVAIGLLGVAVVVFLPGDYPWWMRVEQAVQLVLLVFVAYVIRRPQVRAAFPGWTETAISRRRRERRERAAAAA